MKPALNLLYWPAGRYVPSHLSNIRVRFDAVRAQRKQSADLARQETEANQTSIQSIFAKRIREAK